MGAASRWWLHHSLTALAGALASRGSTLMLAAARRRRKFRASPLPCARRTRAHCGQAPNPRARQLDRDVAARIGAAGHRTAQPPHDHGVRPRPPRARNWASRTAFIQRSREPAGPARHRGNRCPRRSASYRLLRRRLTTLADWHLLPTRPDWAAGLRATWCARRRGAQQRFDAFLIHGAGRLSQRPRRPRRERNVDAVAASAFRRTLSRARSGMPRSGDEAR